MTYGDFAGPAAGNGFGVPRGVVLDRDLSRVHPVDLTDPSQIQEFVAHAWYKYRAGQPTGRHPYEDETTLDYTGPPPPFERLDAAGTYSWVKAPRWFGRPMDTGPLARIVLWPVSCSGPYRALARIVPMHAVADVPATKPTADVLGRLGLPFRRFIPLSAVSWRAGSKANCWSTAWRAGTRG